MKISGNYRSQDNSFVVNVKTYDPRKGSWDQFGKGVTLYPAEERSTKGFMRLEVDAVR